MAPSVQIAGRSIGEGNPVYIIAEIGINHNGDLDIAKRLIDAASFAGCDAVKFQKRTPDLCVPPGHHDIPRETPWGVMSYLDYARKIGGFGPAFHPSGDLREDMDAIRAFYDGKMGKFPALSGQVRLREEDAGNLLEADPPSPR